MTFNLLCAVSPMNITLLQQHSNRFNRIIGGPTHSDRLRLYIVQQSGLGTFQLCIVELKYVVCECGAVVLYGIVYTAIYTVIVQCTVT